jgi:hypothetical protein
MVITMEEEEVVVEEAIINSLGIKNKWLENRVNLLFVLKVGYLYTYLYLNIY